VHQLRRNQSFGNKSMHDFLSRMKSIVNELANIGCLVQPPNMLMLFLKVFYQILLLSFLWF